MMILLFQILLISHDPNKYDSLEHMSFNDSFEMIAINLLQKYSLYVIKKSPHEVDLLILEANPLIVRLLAQVGTVPIRRLPWFHRAFTLRHSE